MLYLQHILESHGPTKGVMVLGLIVVMVSFVPLFLSDPLTETGEPMTNQAKVLLIAGGSAFSFGFLVILGAMGLAWWNHG